jgi:hypothetical protein
MTALIVDAVFDGGLTAVASGGSTAITTTEINYTQQATTYTEAITTFNCGNAAAVPTGPTAGATSGRKITNPSIASGSVTATQTAGWYSLVRTTNTTLYFANSLSATQALTNGNTFSLAAFDCTLRGTT